MNARNFSPEGRITAESFALKCFVKMGTMFINDFDDVCLAVQRFPVCAPKLRSKAVASTKESWSIFGAIFKEVITPTLGIPDTARFVRPSKASLLMLGSHCSIEREHKIICVPFVLGVVFQMLISLLLDWRSQLSIN